MCKSPVCSTTSAHFRSSAVVLNEWQNEFELNVMVDSLFAMTNCQYIYAVEGSIDQQCCRMRTAAEESRMKDILDRMQIHMTVTSQAQEILLQTPLFRLG